LEKMIEAHGTFLPLGMMWETRLVKANSVLRRSVMSQATPMIRDIFAFSS
jgi:hypothetical protein